MCLDPNKCFHSTLTSTLPSTVPLRTPLHLYDLYQSLSGMGRLALECIKSIAELYSLRKIPKAYHVDLESRCVILWGKTAKEAGGRIQSLRKEDCKSRETYAKNLQRSSGRKLSHTYSFLSCWQSAQGLAKDLFKCTK
jgi:hypothetical protein